MLEAASTRLDQLVAHPEHVDKKPFGQAVASDNRCGKTEPFFRQLDVPVPLHNVTRFDRVFYHLGCKNVIAVLDLEEILGRNGLPPLPFHIENGYDLIERNVRMISIVLHGFVHGQTCPLIPSPT